MDAFPFIRKTVTVLGLTGILAASTGCDHSLVGTEDNIRHIPEGVKAARGIPIESGWQSPSIDDETHARIMDRFDGFEKNMIINYYIANFWEMNLGVEDTVVMGDRTIYSLRHPGSGTIYRVTLVREKFPNRANKVYVDVLNPTALGSHDTTGRQFLAKMEAFAKNRPLDETVEELKRFGDVGGLSVDHPAATAWLRLGDGRYLRVIIDRPAEGKQKDGTVIKALGEYRLVEQKHIL